MLFGWFRSVKLGTVIAKSHYSARGVQRITFGDTNFNKGKQMVSVWTTTLPYSESWSLTVRDIVNHRTVEIYVYELQFNNTQPGDRFTGVDKVQ